MFLPYLDDFRLLRPPASRDLQGRECAHGRCFGPFCLSLLPAAPAQGLQRRGRERQRAIGCAAGDCGFRLGVTTLRGENGQKEGRKRPILGVKMATSGATALTRGREAQGAAPRRALHGSQKNNGFQAIRMAETGGRRLTHHHASAHQAACATRGRGQTHTPRRTPTGKPPSPPCASGSCIGGFGLVALLFLFEQLLVFRVGRDDSEFFAFESVGIALGIASAVCLGVVSALGGMGELR